MLLLLLLIKDFKTFPGLLTSHCKLKHPNGDQRLAFLMIYPF